MVARRAHNPKVVGSNPAPATKYSPPCLHDKAVLFCLQYLQLNFKQYPKGRLRTLNFYAERASCRAPRFLGGWHGMMRSP